MRLDGRMRNGMALLELKAVSKHFGAIEALAGVNLHLEPGEIVGLNARSDPAKLAK